MWSFLGKQNLIFSVKQLNKITSLSRNVSHFKRPSKLYLKDDQLSVLSRTMEKDDLTFQDLQNLRCEIIEIDRNINEVNVDSCIVGYCSKEVKLDTAKLYLDFLKSQKIEVNFATYGKLLKLYYLHSRQSQISQEAEDEILTIVEILMKKHSILDASTAENVIFALCATKAWKQTLDFLRMIKLSCKPNASTYSVMIATAFYNRDYDTGWKLLREMISNQRIALPEVYMSWFKNCPRNIEDFEKMMYFIGNNNVLIPKNVGVDLAKAFHELGFVGKFSKVNKQGKCNCCLSRLKQIDLNAGEFERLANKFLNQVLVRENVYIKTNPEELERFKKFVEKTAPYDCVIDGLNVAYSMGTNKSPGVYARILTMVVKHFVDDGKRVLVLGRKHMMKWPRDQMTYINKNSLVFLTENISEDDPFLLYAALRSGPKTDIFSRDLMRSHSFLLEDEEKNIFLRWQQKHQFSLVHAAPGTGKLLIKKPFRFQINAHKNHEKFWHIPIEVEIEKLQTTLSNFELPPSWLCISKFQ